MWSNSTLKKSETCKKKKHFYTHCFSLNMFSIVVYYLLDFKSLFVHQQNWYPALGIIFHLTLFLHPSLFVWNTFVFCFFLYWNANIYFILIYKKSLCTKVLTFSQFLFQLFSSSFSLIFLKNIYLWNHGYGKFYVAKMPVFFLQ